MFDLLLLQVPVLSTSGIAKLFIIPGWRLGWVVINDRNGAFGPEVTLVLNLRFPSA